MAVSLDKPGRIHDLPELDMIMGNEEWRSTVLLPMYLSTVYPQRYAQEIYEGLALNELRDLWTLLVFEHRYDNTTERLVER